MYRLTIVSAFTVLAAALLWLLPIDLAQAQNEAAGQNEVAGPQITDGPVITSSPESGDTYRSGGTITVAVTVTVLNVDEAGVVSLVTENDAPTAGSEISAVLLDPDGGVTGLAWAWERSADGSAWTAITGATAAAYTPANDDAGHYLPP